MKRSEINEIMEAGAAFLRGMSFHLPPFAWWSPSDWRRKGPECSAIAEQGLGWDITDFGSGEFRRVGLLVFTLRNGTLAELEKPLGRIYAEKILIVQEEQVTPTHFHFQKMEDIINRGGGELSIQLWGSTPAEELADTPVEIAVDSVRRTVRAGDTIVLAPGQSVCLPQRLYHKFWGREGTGPVLVGEVSRVNDDHVDNRFFDPVGRFPAVEEDVEPLHLLVGDYGKYLRP